MARRIVIVVIVCFAVFFVGGVLSAGRACAHDPRFACSPRPPSHPVVVADPTKSWAFYGDLASGQEDDYTFATARAIRVPFNILLDRRDTANPARPRVVVSDQRGRPIATADLRHPVTFFEPFSRVTYLSSPVQTLDLSPGTYRAIVTMSDGSQPQRYAFAIGANERFSPFEIPYVFGALYRIHERRF